jgi:hypothetical protein
MKRTSASLGAKRAALSGRSANIGQRAGVYQRRERISTEIKKALTTGKLNPRMIGDSGLPLMTLNLKAVGNLKKRRMLARLVAASARTRR